MLSRKKKIIIAAVLGVVGFSAYCANTQDTTDTEYVHVDVEEKTPEPVKITYKGTIKDLKKYAAKVLNCEPEFISIKNVLTCDTSISGDAVVEGSDKEYFICFDWNEERPTGISVGPNFYWITKDDKLTKNLKED